MEIVNFKKFLISTILLVICFITLLILISNSAFSYGTPNYTSIYIEYGDTLWKISEEQQINNQYYQGKDIRYIIKDIKQINNLNSCNLSIGQELLIPTI